MATPSVQSPSWHPDRKTIVGAFLCLLAATLLIVSGDRWLSHVALTWQTPFELMVLKKATWLGNWAVEAGLLLLAVGVGSLLRPPHLRAAGLHGLSALFLTGLLTTLLKHTICRTRPLLPEAGTFHPPLCLQNGIDSLPSGHAAQAFAIAVILAGAYPRLAPLFYGLAAMVGFSRVVLGVHYPSDVLVGAAIGLLGGVLCRRQFQRLTLAWDTRLKRPQHASRS